MLRPHSRHVRSPGPALVITEPECKWAPHPQDSPSCFQDTRPACFLRNCRGDLSRVQKGPLWLFGVQMCISGVPLSQGQDLGAAETPSQRGLLPQEGAHLRPLCHLLVLRTGRTSQARPQEFILARASRPQLRCHPTGYGEHGAKWIRYFPEQHLEGSQALPQTTHTVLRLKLGETGN